MNPMVVVGALIVLVAAAFFLVRELRAGKSSKPVRKARSEPPQVSVQERNEPDEPDELTTMGVVKTRGSDPAKAPVVLTRLASDDPDEEESCRSEAVTLFEDAAEVDEPTNPRELFFVAAVAQSDKGIKRKRNEDSFLMLDEHALYVVADGMGGYAGGDVASQLAVDTVGAAFASERFPHKIVDGMRPVHALQLVSAIESAHKAIVTHAAEHPDLRGMGTTIVGARFVKKKQRVYIAHVGDSRCYRLREGTLKLLTADHTLAARGIPAPMGNSIRRAVGIGKRVKVDLLVDVPLPNDVYLLCSDGLNKMVSDDVIRNAMVEATSESGDVDALAKRLVDAANLAGGKDNITALVARVLSARPAPPS